MCQPVKLEEKFVNLVSQYMWKVVHKKDKLKGPFYQGSKGLDGWAKPVKPRTYCRNSTIDDVDFPVRWTEGGYHVFCTEKSAYDYLLNGLMWATTRKDMIVQRVLVKGTAIKFYGIYGEGYAVETFK